MAMPDLWRRLTGRRSRPVHHFHHHRHERGRNVRFDVRVFRQRAGHQRLIVDTNLDVVDGTTTSVAALLAGKGVDGFISLREAIIATNADIGVAETIMLSSGTYTLSIAGTLEDLAATGDLDITDDLTITGAGTGLTFIDGGAIDRVFQVHAGIVTFSDMTIQNGLTAGAEDGAGIAIAVGADLTLDTVQIRNNQTTTSSGTGGGVHNEGTVTIVDSTISNNRRGRFRWRTLQPRHRNRRWIVVCWQHGERRGGRDFPDRCGIDRPDQCHDQRQ